MPTKCIHYFLNKPYLVTLSMSFKDKFGWPPVRQLIDIKSSQKFKFLRKCFNVLSHRKLKCSLHFIATGMQSIFAYTYSNPDSLTAPDHKLTSMDRVCNQFNINMLCKPLSLQWNRIINLFEQYIFVSTKQSISSKYATYEALSQLLVPLALCTYAVIPSCLLFIFH